MIGGGAQLYEQLFPLADRMYLTIVDAHFDGDTYFPDFDVGEWKQLSFERHEPNQRNPYRHRFMILERRGIDA
jgi:dihydrofolate reductase